MSRTQALKNLARAQTREILAECKSFQSLGREDQLSLYKDMVGSRYDELARQTGMRPQAMTAFPTAMAEKASDRINDARHENKRIEQAGELAGDFINEVDFPQFVKDLLEAVFDANLKVTITQMETYQKLLKTATASVSKFVNAIDDTAAFGYLAENQGDDFNFDFGDEKDENGEPKAVLTNKDGEKLDIGDNEVKAKIMEAKIAMAKEQRALLRETILMGITRLVVEKGVVKASVLFDIKASEKIAKDDKAAIKESKSSSSSVSASGGLIGAIFGGPKGGHTTSNRKTNISVASTKSASTTDLSAKLAGSVEIQFKSDYFKLDNFAAMYAPQPPAGAPGAPPAAPAPAQ